MSRDSRLSKLLPGLTARERAILVLQSWREDKQEDLSWRRTMPQNQTNEFNRYIGLMNVANRELHLLIGRIEHMADKLDVRFAWLTSLILWQEHVDEIRRAVRVAVREPISEGEYAARVEANRSRWVDLEELAAELASDAGGWREEDYEADEEGHQQLTDEAWDRVCGAKKGWLLEQIAAGNLEARGKGRRLKVQEGDFDDLIGHEGGAAPQDYLSYRVVPDSEAAQTETDRALLGSLQRVLDWKPVEGGEGSSGVPDMPGRLLDALKVGIAGGLILAWVELRTTEHVLEEIGVEFEGADPLKPRGREMLAETKRRLLKLQEELRYFRMEVVLRDPLPEEIEEMRAFVQERSS